MTVLFLANGLVHDRLGIVASRRVGGAVRRNKAKRLIREIFRLNKQQGSGWDVVVIARADLPDAEFSALEVDFRSIRQRHAKRARA
jgi:ribonuclease P protein component